MKNATRFRPPYTSGFLPGFTDGPLPADTRTDDRPCRTKSATIREERLRPRCWPGCRLALTAEQIQKLPDNNAAAVAAGTFATTAAEATVEWPYLPPDLFAPDGPWVCLGRAGGPIAPGHMQENLGNAFTNSAFLVFIRLPEGRAATVDYLRQVRAFAQKETMVLPDFPDRTELALVRRALLIDSTNALIASPLTESVQLRIRNGNSMTVHEFRFSRPLLFAGSSGGIRSVAADERDFKTGFRAHAYDPFDDRPLREPLPQTYSR